LRVIVRVYKFYGKKYGLDALSKRRLKISTLDDLNDPFEFRGFKLSSKEARNAWERTRSELFSDKGLICFCKDWSNPVIWSHYAECHRGIALGFDIPAAKVLEVKYRKTRLPFPELSKMPASKLVGLMQSSLATKFKHWEYENEVRVFISADETCPETGLFFADFDDTFKLREIVIGPLSDITSEEIRENSDIGSAKIITSRLAFRDYRVAIQRRFDLQK